MCHINLCRDKPSMFTQIEVPRLKKVTKKPWDYDRKPKEDRHKKGFEVELKKAEVNPKEMGQYKSKRMEIPDLKRPEKSKPKEKDSHRMDLPHLKHVVKPSAFDEVGLEPWPFCLIYNTLFMHSFLHCRT